MYARPATRIYPSGSVMRTWNRTNPALVDHFDGPLEPRRRRRLRARRWAERLLIAIGVLCLGYFIYAYGEARLYQAFEDEQLDEILSSEVPAQPTTPAVPRRPR